jgi:hypothetical protein
MKIMKKAIILLILFVLTGCVHSVKLTNIESGVTLRGTYTKSDRSMEVTMPDGEVLYGTFSRVTDPSARFGNAFGGQTAYNLSAGGRANLYALLKSIESDLMMEIFVLYNELDGHGFGDARTNDNRGYKVQF